MNDQLANDRTFLAWLRTGIALCGLGFVVAKVALIAQPNNAPVDNEGLYAAGGIVMVFLGAALIVVGFLQHRTVAHLLPDDTRPPPRWPSTITAIAVAGAVFLAVLIIVSS